MYNFSFKRSVSWSLVKCYGGGFLVTFHCTCERQFISFLFQNESVIEELKATGKFEVMDLRVDENEHSMEMHLPYLAKVFEG